MIVFILSWLRVDLYSLSACPSSTRLCRGACIGPLFHVCMCHHSYGGRIPHEPAHDQLTSRTTGLTLPRRACDNSDPATNPQQPHKLSGQNTSHTRRGHERSLTRDTSRSSCSPSGASRDEPRPSPAPASPPSSATQAPSRTLRPPRKARSAP